MKQEKKTVAAWKVAISEKSKMTALLEFSEYQDCDAGNKRTTILLTLPSHADGF